MNEQIHIKALDKTVDFESHLSSRGIHVYVKTKLTEDEKKAFESQLRHERDVVTIRYN